MPLLAFPPFLLPRLDASALPIAPNTAKGVDIYDTKFNIVSPGADPDIYFPFGDADRRLTTLHGELKASCTRGGGRTCRGCWRLEGAPLRACSCFELRTLLTSGAAGG